MKELDRNGSSFYTMITVAAVFDPNMGNSVRKLTLRLVFSAAAAGIGMGVLELASVVSAGDGGEGHSRAQAAQVVAACLAVLGFLLAVHRQRWQKLDFAFAVAILTLPIITLPGIRNPNVVDRESQAYRMLNVLLGIALAGVVSMVVLPVRARALLRRRMASTLARMGDLCAWVLGQACEPPAKGSWLLGTTGTDRNMRYSDDGVEARLAPLMATASELMADVAAMQALLADADREWDPLAHPRRFPTAQYRQLLQACLVTTSSLVALLQSMRSLGRFNLESCQRHTAELSEVGAQLSVAFTAISNYIGRPKRHKRDARKAQTQQHRRKGWAWPWGGAHSRGSSTGADAALGSAAAGQLGPALAAAPSHAAAAATAVDVEALRGGQADDPFAGLAAEGKGSRLSSCELPADLVTLTSMQLSRVGHVARQLSAGGEGSSRGQPPPSSTAAGGSAAAGAAAGAGAATAEQERVLLRLKQLCDAVARLEAAAQQEQESSDAGVAGVSALAMLSSTCGILARQAGACFTAVDPHRGLLLHEHALRTLGPWHGEPLDPA